MELQEQRPVATFTRVDRDAFLRDVCPQRRPAVRRGMCLGPCLEKWMTEYLVQRGGDREGKVHVSPVPQMDFLHKNFVYKTLPFNEIIKRESETKHSDFFLCEDESYYLRSLGKDVRKFFSSVFRISSRGLQLWTHYDVMENLLAQVTGRKRVVLYSPQDVLQLYLSGDKSEVLDIDAPDLKRFPDFVKAKCECVLEPGDLLFIPALWFHNTCILWTSFQQTIGTFTVGA